MIYDCFLFHSEWELLKIRCEELIAHKCKHILIQSPYTFSGKKKNLAYKEGVKVALYDIDSYVFDDMPNNGNPWENEKAQRNYIKTVLQFYDPNDNDIIILSDVDEVPRHEAVKYYKPSFGLTGLLMDKYSYFLNCLEGKQSWSRARIMPWSYLKDKTPEEVRNSGFALQLTNAGFHWSWLGGVDAIQRKLESFSHSEFNTLELNNVQVLSKKLEMGQSLWTNDPDDTWTFVPIDESFPQFLYQNQDKFSNLIKQL